MSAIEFSDVTAVVQGPVQAYQGRSQDAGITHKCLQSIREYLPGAKIILSTWEGQDCSGLEPDTLLLNNDPGGTISYYSAEGIAKQLNFNRQILSTATGLKEVTTDYAIKIRSDNFLTGNDFINLQQKFQTRNTDDVIFKERVIVNTSYFRCYANGMKVIMHPSDFFHYGRTEDLLKIWDIPLFEDLQYDESKVGQAQYWGAPKACLHAEQVYCNAWLGKLIPELQKLAHQHDTTPHTIEFWERFIASNFIVLEPDQINLGLPDRFIPKSKRVNEMSYFDWVNLYSKYCDAAYPNANLKQFFSVGWKRAIKNPMSKLKYNLKN